MRTILFILLSSLCVNVLAQQDYARLKIYLHGKDISQLAALGMDVEHGFYAKHRFFIGDFSEKEQQKLAQHHFKTEVLIDKVSQYYVDQNNSQASPRSVPACDIASEPYTTPQNFQLGSMGGFYTYQEMLDNLDSMARAYPNLISFRMPIDSFNPTHEGRLIYWLRISDNAATDENQPELLYTSLHHAREPGSLSQLIFYMWYLLENYSTDPLIKYLVDETEMYFIPCINPDGYIYNETTNPSGGGLWRKNRRNNGSGSFGVDLNRNYGYEWGFDNIGSSNNPADETYRGPSAFSEPETQNVRDFCNAHDFQICLNYHTYGNLLIYPWGFSDQPTVDSALFFGLAGYLTRDNNYTYGTGSETVGYTVNGDSDDWMYGDSVAKPKIYAMTPEAGSSSFGFWPPSNQIIDICKDNMHQNLGAVQLLLNQAGFIEQSPAIVESTNNQILYTLERTSLNADSVEIQLTVQSSNVVSVGAANKYLLALNQPIMDSISFQLTSDIEQGESIELVLNLYGPQLLQSDTIRKYFGSESPVFADAGDTMTNWTAAGEAAWATTTTDFVSPPSSFTESPGGNSLGNQNYIMQLKTPIALPDTLTSASLTFWAKWEIEKGFDYAQVSVSTDNINFDPLCGNYTVIGNQNQDEDQPVYDGFQLNWVEEFMDLTPYIGNDVYIRFRLKTDFFTAEDGFYMDDLLVSKTFVVDTSSGQQTSITTAIDIAQWQLFPNPANDQVLISAPTNNESPTVVIYNSMGKLITSFEHRQTQTMISTFGWPAGIYFIQYQGITKRLIVLH